MWKGSGLNGNDNRVGEASMLVALRLAFDPRTRQTIAYEKSIGRLGDQIELLNIT
jgi:hypothetical protein